MSTGHRAMVNTIQLRARGSGLMPPMLFPSSLAHGLWMHGERCNPACVLCCRRWLYTIVWTIVPELTVPESNQCSFLRTYSSVDVEDWLTKVIPCGHTSVGCLCSPRRERLAALKGS